MASSVAMNVRKRTVAGWTDDPSASRCDSTSYSFDELEKRRPRKRKSRQRVTVNDKEGCIDQFPLRHSPHQGAEFSGSPTEIGGAIRVYGIHASVRVIYCAHRLLCQHMTLVPPIKL